MTPHMTCTRCLRNLPAECFVFETARQRYRTVCRQCRNEDNRRRYAANPEYQQKANRRSQAQRAHPGFAADLRKQRKEGVDGISDAYIVRLLTRSKRSNAKNAGIPQALIDLKRVHLQLARHITQMGRKEA